MLLAKLFQELKRHNKFDFEVKFLVMDPGYSPVNRQVIEENARRLEIPIEIFESEIFESVFNIGKIPMLSLCKNASWIFVQSCAEDGM